MIELRVKYLNGINRIPGLITSKKAHPVYFKTRFGIHTFGLRFPIDVLILDKGNRVVRIRRDLKPYRIFLWNPAFDKVIELPAGEIQKKKIKLGNRLSLKLATEPGFEPE